MDQRNASQYQSFSSESEITLGVLKAIEGRQSVTQRSLASELGIALGLTNSYLKRCIKKGLIKVKQAPSNRYAYYLTPMGFAEKARLTAEYLSESVRFFREAREEYNGLLIACRDNDVRTIAFAGASDLAEIAAICAAELGVEITAIIDSKSSATTMAGLPVAPAIDRLAELDAIIVTDLSDPQSTYDTYCRSIDPSQILAPPLLNITSQPCERKEG